MINFAKGKFSPKALNFIQTSDARLNIAHGSVRSSKTVNCSVRWLCYLMEAPEGDLLMVGKTIASLQRNVLNDIADLAGPKYYKWTDRQKGELKLFGRRVHVVGANTVEAEERIRGATLAGALCDEVTTYPQSFFDMLMTRLSIKGAKCFCNCNPDYPGHWFYKNYIINSAILDKKIWHFVLADNPNLDSDYIAYLNQAYTGVFYDRFILGQWVAAEGVIYPGFKNGILAHEQLPTSFEEYGVSLDYGTSNATAMLLWGLHAGVWYAIKEFYHSGRDSKSGPKTDGEYFEDLQQLAKGTVLSWVIVDPSAASFITLIRKSIFVPGGTYLPYECKVRLADNDVVNGIRETAEAIQCGLIKISDQCTHLIEESGGYIWDTKTGNDVPLKIADHAMDALRYFVKSKRVLRFGKYNV